MRAATWLVALAGGLAVVSSACTFNDYCLNCIDPDALGQDGGGLDGPTSDAVDATPRADGCTPSAVEVCDGIDNDCDTLVDEGDLPSVGESCGQDAPPCSIGTWSCEDGALACSGVVPTAELCDDIDNDCDGTVDDGDPEGGVRCGSDFGECVAGTTRCLTGGVVDCVGDVGSPGEVPEICDGRDNDCDNVIDESLTFGSCGTSDVGECALGTETCVGGVVQCVGAIAPAFELCDTLDQDCDGAPTNGYNLATDVQNCGECGVVCAFPNAVPRCQGGLCAIASCLPGFFDIDPVVDGCEYACAFQGAQEACNGRDDDCDGTIDEAVTPPANLCEDRGVCAGTTATCSAGGWACAYPPEASTDVNGQLEPEATCDGLDNDCNGFVDDAHPSVGEGCQDSGVGICQGRGTYICDAGNPSGPALCDITDPGATMTAEVCNGQDDNCDGTVDEGATTGVLQEWVSIGGGRQILKYEASRPDATSTATGAADDYVCARAETMPWVNITQPQAEAACASIGARLCTEPEWQRACSVVEGTTFPVTEPAANNGYVFFEAEDYFEAVTATSGGTLRGFLPDRAPTGYSGLGAMRASPNTGANVSAANAPSQSPRLGYQMTFTTAGDHYVWVRMYGATDSNNSLWTSIGDPTVTPPQQLSVTAGGTWTWVRSGAISVTAGTRLINIFMREDGTKFDAVVVTRSTSGTAPTEVRSDGGTWAYATNPSVAQPGVCNDDSYDTDAGTAGDQDDLLPSGELASCYAAWPGGERIYDLSGNAREWTAERLPATNPIRGGTSNNTTAGVACGLNFTVADDDFYFPNVGFRCCR